jgi:hypothetical protein
MCGAEGAQLRGNSRLPPAQAGGTPADPDSEGASEGFYSGGRCGYNRGSAANPERINPMKALWLCLCLGLAACADTGTKPWYRADGSANAPGQLEADKTACQQEMKNPQATRASGLDRDVVQADVYEKCMTRLGYTDSKLRAATPPNGAPAAPPVVAAPAGAPPAGAPPTSAVAGAPAGATPAAPSADCRKVTDLRMWLPLCP